jgi:hypothetical protein
MATSTYADLQNQVANDLRRSNLTAEIAQAILDAIQDHDSERFYFNETEIYNFNTVANQDVYPITPQPPIQEFIMIDMVRSQVGNTWFTLERETPDQMEIDYSAPTSGQPFEWSIHGNELRLFPMPNKVYPVRIFGHYRIVPLVNGTDSNQWTTIAKNLIRYSALKRLYAYPIRDMQQSQVAEAREVQEVEYLRRETDRRARTGQMAAYYG